LSLLARIAWVGATLLAVCVLVALLVWKPASRDEFVQRTEGLLRATEDESVELVTALVDDTMEFAAASAQSVDEQRATSLQDLPLELFVDEDGRLVEKRLREALRNSVTDPESSGAAKLAAVRAELLARTREDVMRRLARLRKEQVVAAELHGEEVAWKTVAAWSGLLLLLLAGSGLLLDQVALRPLRDATVAVERFGAGERGVRLDPRGARELATFARVFNETATANEHLRDSLEEKVRERTAALVRAARASTAGTMAGGVAHEFNNLLGGILGCTDEALGEDLTDDMRALLDMIRKTASRGVGMTQSMLRATSADPELEPCDPDALVDEALAEVRPGPGIELTHTRANTKVPLDAAMMLQVLSNLVRNAVHAMGDAGRLQVVVAVDDGGLKIEVQDDGPGIDPAVREILFEPFVTTRRGGREGAGLGLFLSERLIAAHGGRIDVDSAPGSGTQFTIRIPSARDS
jgi:signal transduction histidine kinase